MVNVCVLVGRTTAQPELRYSEQGAAICKFTLAVDRAFSKNKEADFIRVVCFKKTAEAVAQHSGKGRMLAVSGRLQVRSYDAQDGSKRTIAEVVAESVQFLDWPKDKPEPGAGAAGSDIEDIFSGQMEGPELPF